MPTWPKSKKPSVDYHRQTRPWDGINPPTSYWHFSNPYNPKNGIIEVHADDLVRDLFQAGVPGRADVHVRGGYASTGYKPTRCAYWSG